MARRIQVQFVLILFLLAATATGQIDRSNILVSYSFDDDQLATGPDTFAVFAQSRGTVRLNGLNKLSGYRSIEIHDVAGDGDFPELQGYFEPRSKGTLFLHFAFMTATLDEELNIALAGPQWFKLGKDGIGFWLKTQEGWLYQVSDSMPKKLFLLEPFCWYVVNVAYDIDKGSYDLVIHKEGIEKPVLSLAQQANASKQPGSAVDKFSFIGDTKDDKSNVTYYVDDVVVGIDEAVIRLPFVAPGRRKLFFDYWSDAQRRQSSELGPIKAVSLSDLGIHQREIERIKAAGMWESFVTLVNGRAGRSEIPQETPSDVRQLLEAVALWSEGANALKNRNAEQALERFDAAGSLVPSGKIYDLNAVLALAALQRWDAVDERLARIYSSWQEDIRFPFVMATIGLARQNLDEAERWLRGPAEQIPDQTGQQLLQQLRGGALNPDLLQKLQTHFPGTWDDYLKEVFRAEQYFLLLLWKNQGADAERFAQRMADRYEVLGIPAARWHERSGDAAFLLGNFTLALERYEKSLKEQASSADILVKLSDVYFRLGDLENERLYREKIYGAIARE